VFSLDINGKYKWKIDKVFNLDIVGKVIDQVLNLDIAGKNLNLTKC